MADNVSDKKKSSREVPRMTEDEIRQFVLNVCDGHVFTSAQCEPAIIHSIFMPIALGAFEGWTEDECSKVGCIWEHMKEAGPRSINGMPMFMSLRMMHIEDWDRARVAIAAEFERRKEIVV